MSKTKPAETAAGDPKDPKPPETLADTATAKPPKPGKPVKTVKLHLITHMIFEGDAKAPGDEIEVPEAEEKNWTSSGIAKLPAEPD